MIEIMNLRKVKPTEIYDYYIDRRSPVGNPFFMKNESKRDAVCDAYEVHFQLKMKEKCNPLYTAVMTFKEVYQKHGKLRLFCWCAPKRCHGRTIKEWLENQLSNISE